MKKKLLGLSVLGAVATVAVLASCNGGGEAAAAKNDSGNIFHIYAWNTEFQGFFNKYVSDQKSDKADKYTLDGVEVKWTITTSDNGAYQNALDAALRENRDASEANKVDMFLAEADYILKYTNTSLTKDVTKIGVTDFSQTYKYTVDAASSSQGVIKGVSFQCCPAGLVYRRSIAKDVLGTDDPAEVQKAVASWAKFDETAASMKGKGYLMTGSYADTYRVFSNNAATPWVDANKNLTIPAVVNDWMAQAANYVEKGYTTVEGVWDGGKTSQFASTGKVFCTFGPAWYYNFCMGPAMGSGNASKAPDGSNAADPTNTYGDWAVIEGPQNYFWGGTWMLATADSTNDTLVAKTMNAFLNDESVCTNLVKVDAQFSNNKKVNNAVAEEYTKDGKGNGFLKGQNDTALWASLADKIVFKNNTIYDQQCNEGLQTAFVKYLKGDKDVNTKEKAITEFYTELKKSFPNIVTK